MSKTIREIDIKKWESIMLSFPIKDGREYYIYSLDFGMMNKKEAEIITAFLRKNIYILLNKLRP